jgi:hypothetical protein
MEVTPVFHLKDSQLFNYAMSKISLQTIGRHLALPIRDSTLGKDWIQVQGAGNNIKAIPQLLSDTTMPNLTGMKLQDALWICEKKGLLVKCAGKGKVVSQSIAQGQSIIKGQQIQIQLN